MARGDDPVMIAADEAVDGDDTTSSSRWTRKNNREDASHYIQLEFPEEISVSFVVLKFRRQFESEPQICLDRR